MSAELERVKARRKWSRTVAVQVTALAVIAALLVLAPATSLVPSSTPLIGAAPAEAQVVPPTPPSICGGSGSVAGTWPQRDTWSTAQIYVPPGASLAWSVSGSVTGVLYFGQTDYRAYDRVDFRVREVGSTTDLHSRAHNTYFQSTNAGPFAWQEGPFTWVNNGLGRVLEISTGAPIVGGVIAAANSWTVAVSIQGSGILPYYGSICEGVDPEETAVPNPSEPNSCGANPSVADPVNTVLGNYWQSWTDHEVPGPGRYLDLTRTYSSGPNPGWSWSYGASLSVADYQVDIVQENGSVVRFFEENPGQFRAATRVNATLTRTGTFNNYTHTFTRAGRDVLTFHNGLLMSIADLQGNTTTLTYGVGGVDTVTDPVGRVLDFTWQLIQPYNGYRITQVTGPSAALTLGGAPQALTTTYAYNAAGMLTTVTDAAGGVWTYGYSASTPLLLTSVREPRHHSLGVNAPIVENHYDAQGRIDWQEDRLNNRTTFVYSGTAPGVQYTTVTDPDNHVVAYRHQGGICTGVTVGTGPQASTWAYEVDPLSLGRTKVTDPNGLIVTAVYNNIGLPTSITTGKGTTNIVYNGPYIQRITDPNQWFTEVSMYGDNISYLSRTNPATGEVVVIDPTYDGPFSQISSLSDERGKVWQFAYNALGDVNRSTDPLGNATTYTYNEVGWTLAVVAPAGNVAGGTPQQFQTSWSYDRLGRALTETDQFGRVRTFARDLSGLVTTITDPVLAGESAEVTVVGRDNVGRITSLGLPNSTTVSTEYWPNGSLKAQLDGLGNRTSYAYDTQGRLSTVTNPLGLVTTLSYVFGDRVRNTQQPGGNCGASPKTGCISYSYFPTTGELQTVDYSDPNTSDVSFGYDALGRQTSMVDSAGTSTWSWDWIGRLKSFTDPVSGTVSYGYLDDGSTPTSITYPGNRTVTRAVDNAGQISAVTAWLGGTAGLTLDPNANVSAVNTPATGGTEDTRTIDAADQLTGLTVRNGSTSIFQLTAGRLNPGGTRDAEGAVRSTSATGSASSTFTYDSLDRVISDSTGSYQYDAASNLRAFSDGRRQQFNAGNQICYQASTNTAPCSSPPASARRYTYDSRGNRTTEVLPDGTSRQLGWDQANRLVSAAIPNTAAATGQFTPVAPTRIMDSRASLGNCTTLAGGVTPCDPFTSTESVQLQVTGTAGVPANAAAVLLNVTVVGGAGSGYVSVFPSGIAQPSVSNVNYPAANPISNGVLTRLGSDGKIVIYVHTAADVIVDVAGWYASPTNGAGGELHSLNPARVLDTRSGLGSCTPSPCAQIPSANSISVQVNGQGGVPATGVEAVVLNVTVTGSTAAGFLVAHKTGTPRPTASNINYTTGQTITGLVTVSPDANGRITLYAHTSLHVIADVSGYYTSGTGSGVVFSASAAPARMLDTRGPQGVCDGTCSVVSAQTARTVQVAGLAGVPANANSVVVTLTSVGSVAAGFLTVYSAGSTRPTATSLSYAAGETIANTVVVPVGPGGRISIYAHTQTHVIADVSGWFAADATSTYTYAYSGDGLRRSKTAPDGTTTKFVWDRSSGLPLLLAEHIDAPGTANDKIIRYIYGPGGLVLSDITQDSAGAQVQRWYHHDQIGSTRSLTSAAGALLASFTYTPFGALASSTGSVTTNIGWAGEYRDPETGYTYLRARYYDPATGQFLSRDPLEALTRSAYGYVNNDPLNSIDPSGLFPGGGLIDDAGDFFTGGCNGGGLLGNIADAVVGFAGDAASFISEYKDEISLALTVASSLIPASLLARGLWWGGFALATWSTAESCSSGNRLGCALGASGLGLGLVGRGLTGLGRVATDAGRSRLAAQWYEPFQRHVTGPTLMWLGGAATRSGRRLGWLSYAPSVLGIMA